MYKDKRDSKERRDRRRAAGKCPHCGVRDPQVPYVHCEKCLTSHREWFRKKTGAKPRNPRSPDDIREYGRQRMADVRMLRRMDGMCTECGRARPIGNGRKCRKCLDKRKAIYARVRARRAVNGKCNRCGHREPMKGMKWCRECRRADRRYVSTRDERQEAKALKKLEALAPVSELAIQCLRDALTR